jgi:hypothetical protein
MKQDENNIHASVMRMANYGWTNQKIADRLGVSIDMVAGQRRVGMKGNSFAKREFDLTEIEIERFGTYNPLLIELERIYLPEPCRLSFSERLNLVIQK